jgi:Zn-dependent peptidase ImmA (M78 family)
VILHGRRDVFIEWEHTAEDAREHEADEFAGNSLIPPDAFARFVKAHRPMSQAAILSFADAQGISPGIVVGRLQHEKLTPYSDMNGLRMKLDWARH